MIRHLISEELTQYEVSDFNWLQFAERHKISTTWGEDMIQEEFYKLTSSKRGIIMTDTDIKDNDTELNEKLTDEQEKMFDTFLEMQNIIKSKLSLYCEGPLQGTLSLTSPDSNIHIIVDVFIF